MTARVTNNETWYKALMTDDLDIGSHDGSDGGEGKSFQGAGPLDSGSDDGSGGGKEKSPQSADPLDFGAIEGR